IVSPLVRPRRTGATTATQEDPMELHGLASVAIRHRKMHAALCAALLLLPRVSSAQGTLEDYRRAATIARKFDGLTTGVTEGLTWIGRTNQAVYRVSVPGGNRFVKVDAEQWTKQPAFDHAAVARSLSSASGENYTEITLPFQSIAFVENGTAFEGNANGSRFRCAVTGATCARVGAATQEAGGRGGRGGGGGGGGGRGNAGNEPRCAGERRLQQGESATEVFSPDCKTVAFIQNYNV